MTEECSTHVGGFAVMWTQCAVMLRKEAFILSTDQRSMVVDTCPVAVD